MVHGQEGAEPSQVPRGPFGAPILPAHEVLRALHRHPLLNDGTQENRALLAGSLFNIFHDDVLPPDLESSQVDHDTDPPNNPLSDIASDSSSDDDSGDDPDAANAIGPRDSEGTGPRPQKDPVDSTTAGQSSLQTPPSSEPATVVSNNAGTNVSDEGDDAATSVLLEERDEGAESHGQTGADEVSPLEEGPGLEEIVDGPEEAAEDEAHSDHGADADEGHDSNEDSDAAEGDDSNEGSDVDEEDDPNESSEADEEEHTEDSSEPEESGADDEAQNDISAPSEVSEADGEEHDDGSPESDESEADEETAPAPTVDALPRRSATLPPGITHLTPTPAGNATSTQVNPRLLPFSATSTRFTLSGPVARQPAQAQLQITPEGIIRPALPNTLAKRPHLGSNDADDTPSKKQC